MTDMPFMQATNTLSLTNPRFAHLAPALETDLEPFSKLQCVAGPPRQVRNTPIERVVSWLITLPLPVARYASYHQLPRHPRHPTAFAPGMLDAFQCN